MKNELESIPGGRPLLVVISGPSGVGKDAILNMLKEYECPFKFVVTTTTRSKRTGEKNGVHYNFVSVDRFQGMLREDKLLESANVYGNWYGVPKQSVEEALKKGFTTIIKVDIQGAATIKKKVPNAIFIFIAPPSMEELYRRLKKRSTESDADFAIRVKKADEEMKQLVNFDYAVINENDMLEEAATLVTTIITAELCRVKPRNIVI